MVPIGIVAMVVLTAGGDGVHVDGLPGWIWVVGAGLMTSTPLLFAFAARQIPLWTVGVLQYITPTLQFLLGVLAYDEDWSGGQVAGYSIIWFGLIVFVAEGVARARRMRERGDRSGDLTPRGARSIDAVADRRAQRVAHDRGDHLILTRLGQVVAHVGEHEQPRAGIAAAVAVPPDGATRRSPSPWITREGAFTLRRPAVRSSLPPIAAA